ncbi:Os02g0275401 [Oryza sativa Japonica Group]|uniref:Os02g0275401 protein n=1 Tax=Oryza sativa subsp. japonica TaxID=39947 RepID=A0A0P0VHG0_ORYSJ|nr:Os02g0275401 [Oryza sativa Japonica Group]
MAMDLTFRGEGKQAPVYRPGSKYLSLEFHHGGFFCGLGVNRTYIDGKVDWFDNEDSREWGRVLHLPDFIAMLGYDSGPSLKVYWLLPGKTLVDGLRIVDSGVEINVMNSVCNKIKNFVIYLDHTDHVSGRIHEDLLLTPAAELSEVFSPTRDDHQEPNLSTDEHTAGFRTAKVNQKSKGIEEEEVEEFDLFEDSDDSSADSDFVDSDYE